MVDRRGNIRGVMCLFEDGDPSVKLYDEQRKPVFEAPEPDDFIP
jgi:hypothetical protein